MRIMLATNNPSKVARVRKQLAGYDVEIVTPADFGITSLDVQEGSDIAVNALVKARAYLGLVDVPVLGMDSAFVIEGEDLDPSQVRRNALGDRDESTMTRQEIGTAMLEFYRAIAARHGGAANASWMDAFALVLPNGSVRAERNERPVILTDIATEPIDYHFPIRSLYSITATGKRPAEQNEAEEWLELQPFREALERLLNLS